MKLKISKNTIGYIWCFLISVSIAVRCLPTMIYQTLWIEFGLIMTFTVCTVLFNFRSIIKCQYTIYDFIWLITPVFFLIGTAGLRYVFYTIIAILFYLYIQVNTNVITALKYPLLIFSYITSAITWLSFFAPDFYISRILAIFPEGSSLAYSFKNRNMYHGLTNHYSRNSFYITVGILILFSEIMSRSSKKKKRNIALLVFLICTELLVAKRGLTLFLIMTVIIVIIVKTPGLVKKFKKSLKFIVLGIILFILAYIFVPGVNNIVTRILTPNRSDDISSGRFYLWGVALEMFKRSPLFGRGWGSFLRAMAGTTFQGVHNDYLQLLGELGLAGFALYMTAGISTLVFTYRALKILRSKVYEGTRAQNWIILSFSYQVFFLLYSITGLPHYSYEQYALYIMLCGSGVGMYKALWRERNE